LKRNFLICRGGGIRAPVRNSEAEANDTAQIIGFIILENLKGLKFQNVGGLEEMYIKKNGPFLLISEL